jgi:hypothetical protein
MRRILFAMLVGVLLVGLAKAQEMTGPVAEKLKRKCSRSKQKNSET